jgi:hypothetical protein
MIRKLLSSALCGISLLYCGCHKPEAEGAATVKDLKLLAFAATSYSKDHKTQDSSGVVELADIWYLLPQDTQRRLLQGHFSYFPLRIGASRRCPLAIASTPYGSQVVYTDASTPLGGK